MSRRCRGSWLDTYIEYSMDQESPTAFHEWVSLCILSAIIGRHVWIPRVKYTIYPNLFVILIAGSGYCRKSASIGIGLDIMNSMISPPMVFAQKITTEALIQALEEARVDGSSSGLICAKELATFLGVDATKSGIIPAMTDLYDSPKEWVYHTRGRGREVLRNVTITFLAASTKEWLKAAIPADAVGGGFTSRIIFVCQDKPSKLLLFTNTNANNVLKNPLIADLNDIRETVKGPMVFTPKAMAVAEAWYKESFYKTRDPKLDGYFSRKHDIMFKIASLISISESSGMMIEEIHITKALELLASNEEHLGEIINSVVSNTLGGEAEKILSIIKRHKQLNHSNLLKQCYRFTNAIGLQEHIRTLLEASEIVQVMASDGKTRVYKPNEGRL